MKITFWGVRGSIPSPGPRTARYGGNTTCISVDTEGGELIILDAGTGIFPLSQSLLKRRPLSCSIFVSHTHWDHIQGLPFFAPFFMPGNRISIYGAFSPVSGHSIRDIVDRQMEYCYFPIREAELEADIVYTALREKQAVEVGQAKVTGILMNHPIINFGYLIECGGKSVFFTGDNEPLYNIYTPGDEQYEEYEALISDKNGMLHDFIRGVDVLISDAAYTEGEYRRKRGWGHGTFNASISLAEKAGAKSLYLTHHEPLRSDDELDALGRALDCRDRAGGEGLTCVIAHEGLEISV